MPSPFGLIGVILFAHIMDGIIMVVTNKSIVKNHLDLTKFFFISFVFDLGYAEDDTKIYAIWEYAKEKSVMTKSSGENREGFF